MMKIIFLILANIWFASSLGAGFLLGCICSCLAVISYWMEGEK